MLKVDAESPVIETKLSDISRLNTPDHLSRGDVFMISLLQNYLGKAAESVTACVSLEEHKAILSLRVAAGKEGVAAEQKIAKLLPDLSRPISELDKGQTLKLIQKAGKIRLGESSEQSR